jgi:hypothetical protein
LWIGIVLNADPDTNTLFDTDPDPNPTPSYTQVEKSDILFTFILCNASLLFYLSHKCHRSGITYNIFDRILKFSDRKKYGIAYLYSWLKWIQIRFRIGRPYPGFAKKLCRSYRIRIHNTALQAETDFFVITGCLFCRVCLLVAA